MKTMLKASLMAATIMTGAPVYAQDSADGAEESDNNVIIVTARKKEETLLKAPLAVSVFGEEELSSAGFQDITEVTKAAPGAFVEPYNDVFARVNTTPRFRGVTVLTGSRLQQTATVFLDGVYISGGISTLGINELQRVEIIKGPQSALFGRNTFAGAINYVTKDPAEEFQVNLDVTAATRDEYSAGLSVEGPIGDFASFRLGGNWSDKRGHYANVVLPGERLGDESQWSINGTLVVEPSDSFRVKLRASYQEIDDGTPQAIGAFGVATHNFGGFALDANGVAIQTDSVVPSPLGSGRTESVFRGRITSIDPSLIGLNSGQMAIDNFRGLQNDGRFDPSDAINSFKYNPFNVDQFGLQLDSLRLSAVGEFDITDNVSFNFLAGYNEENFGFFGDFDLRPDDSFTSFTARETEDLTIEGRFTGNFIDDRLTLIAGASYVKLDIVSLGGTANFLFNPIFFGDIFRSDPFITGAETTGLFGLIDFEFNDHFSLTLEGRYQKDRISDADVNLGLATPISPSKITNFLPRATFRYTPTDLTTLYLTYSVGNLPGGFNPEVASLDSTQRMELAALAPEADINFDEEKLENFEFGWKQAHPDGIFAFNLAAFYMKRSDEIFRSIELVTDTSPGAPNPTRTVAFTANGASTDIYGIEFDATVNVSENLSVQGSFAYVDATIASFPVGGGTGDFGDIFGPGADVAGQQAPRFPPLTVSLGGTYTGDLDGPMGINSWYLRSDAYFTGPFYISNANVAQVDEAFDVNLRLGLEGENMGVEFFVTNLFNEDAPNSAFNFADVGFDTRLMPGGFFDFSREGAQIGLRDKRQFGVRLKYTFK